MVTGEGNGLSKSEGYDVDVKPAQALANVI